MRPFNFKSGILPPHCGTCNWLEWEDSTCLCLHPAFLEDSDIQDALEETTTPLKAVDYLYEQLIECGNWHGYDSICNLYTRTTSAEFEVHRAIARLNLMTRVLKAHQKNSAEGKTL